MSGLVLIFTYLSEALISPLLPATSMEIECDVFATGIANAEMRIGSG